MTRLPHPLSDTELLELGERAMRHVATAFHALLDCRRRACRRNGCCGPSSGGGCLALPGGRRIDGARIPVCMTGADPQVADDIERHSCTYLELLLKEPGYNLHPARLHRTFGRKDEEDGAGAEPEAYPAAGGGHHG